MEEINIDSPRQIKKILEDFCLHPHRKWGQNFLADSNIVKKILTEVDLNHNECVIEIGPGLGALTLPMAKNSVFILAIEIDRGLVDFLKRLLGAYDNIYILEGDIRKIDNSRLRSFLDGEGKPVKIVANLPYYITSPFVYRLFEEEIYWEKAVLMMQKEMAFKLQASPGSYYYGSLSVLCNYFTHISAPFNVSSNVFYPAPQVDSTLVVLEPKEKRELLNLEKEYIKLVSEVFRYRRKTMLNSLSYYLKWERALIKKVLLEAEIDPQQRPDSISYEKFANLCSLIYN